MNPAENLLIAADSEHDANMLYAVGMFVPDPFIFLRVRGRNYVVMSDLEIDRARQHASNCRVLSFSRYQRTLRDRGERKAGFAEVINCILRGMRVKSVSVPSNFPLGLANELHELGIQIQPRVGSFFAERELKSPEEVKAISAALRAAEAGMAAGMEVLKSASIRKPRRLMYQGSPLTSERLRAVIDTAILQRGGLANRTIVAGGGQACDPHEPGHGLLRAHEPIILDIFPRSQKTGYFGDMTRTVVRGRASEAVRRLYATVFEGQKLAFQAIRPGVPTAKVHQVVSDYFARQGYRTAKRNGRMEGFFHGTGHGLGLEIHEAPRLSVNSPGVLKPGHVVTVEPGLYFPGLGGVRLEDVAWVTDTSFRNLTRFKKVLEL